MNRKSRCSAICLLTLLAGVIAAPAVAQETCISDWSKAAPMVKEEGLATVERVTELARSKVKGDVVKVTLCREEGRYVYRLVVRAPTGQHKSLTVDAKEPFAR